MWKERPVVASRIGGIRDQIENGRLGMLISDPRDLKAVGEAVGDCSPTENPPPEWEPQPTPACSSTSLVHSTWAATSR
jgi:hypothetical protein